MFRTYLFFTVFGLTLGFTALFLPIWHLLGWFDQRKAQRNLSHYISYYWARLLAAIAGVKVNVRGVGNIPENSNVLFVSNHQGNFDIPVLLGFINKPKGFLAKIELAKIPVLNSWMKKMDCVLIDRKDMRQSIKAVQKCVEVLKGDQSMVLFPEGTRSKGPKMGEFKKGSLRLVEKTDVPIVPVSISGTYKVMEANGNRIRPAEVTVTISNPIYFNKLSREGQQEINSIVREAIEKNL